MGRVLVFSTKGGVNWENEAALEGLGFDETSREPISQICCASALDLILLVVGDELVGLEMKDELQPSPIRKSLLYTLERSQTPNLSVIERCRLSDVSSKCLSVGIAKSGGALKLFDGATDGHAICTFGMEEFALSGVHELVVFVNMHGVSSRPPISVSGRSRIVGLSLKEPFLHVLSEDGTVSIFSTVDAHLVQSLAFPTDEVQEVRQNFCGRSPAPITCQLENIDGIILIASPGDSALYELVPVSVVVQIEEQIQLGNLDSALSMLGKSVAFCLNDVEIVELNHLRKKLAFLLLQNANFSDGIALLSSIDGTDCALAFLSLVANQRPQLGMDPVTHNDQNQVPIDGTFPAIPLEFVKQYLEETIRQRDGSHHPFIALFSCCLARIYAILEDFDSLFRHCDANEWNTVEFRHWLSTERRRPNWAAKLAVQRHCWAEAFATWEGQIGQNGERKADEEEEEREMLEECYATLFKVQKYSEMAASLPWLVRLNAKVCMEAIDALEETNPGEKCPPEEIVKLFQNSEPILLLRYLDSRIYELKVPFLHDKLLDLYVQFIRSDKNGQKERDDGTDPLTENECRQKLRHFLLFSDHLNSEKAAETFGKEKSGKFHIEAILAEANEHNAVDCLQKLMGSAAETDFSPSMKELFSAGQLLCTRFSSPEMLTTMLTLHLRLSSADPTLRANIVQILALLDSATDAAAVLRNVPDDLRSSALVCSFLRRHVAQRTNAKQWEKMRRELVAREQSRTERELGTRSACTKFRVDEQTKCGICERRLKADDEFVRHPHNGQLTHLRCFDERQSV
ncbi:hypothetical protein niasHS_013099 [Heterodera schachtii]|uniref:Vacuolar sorting protein 39/Transforming growth factor beta receptor-associated zinc finger domain-containing protein n=1 Tax=Heterodera schachtii TaxID=97005 RepID=A0ABD2IHS8_HETSC